MSSEDASRLKAARERKGWSQTKLAKEVGVSQGMIGNIEAGTRGFGARVVKIAKVLGVRVEWLANNEGEMLPTNVGEPFAPFITPDDFERLREG